MGYSSEKIGWAGAETTNWHLLGNTIAQPMMERLLVAALRAMGATITDRWENGDAQRQLRAEAARDRIERPPGLPAGADLAKMPAWHNQPTLRQFFANIGKPREPVQRQGTQSVAICRALGAQRSPRQAKRSRDDAARRLKMH